MTASTVSTPTRRSTRLHGLDALRSGALGLGIVLHSLMAFVPGLPWLVNDSQTSTMAWVPIYWIHLFRMVLFMLLAGYFGRMVLHRRGAGAYLKDRLLRIGLPLVGFWPIAVATLIVLAVVNVVVRDVTPAEAPNLDGVPELFLVFSPGHLWFLLVLLECVLITVAVRAVALRLLGAERCARTAASIGRLLSTPAGVAIVAVPYVACLLLQGTTIEGIIAPQTVIPSAPALTAYLGAFLAGWFLHAYPDSLTRLARQWPVQLPVALALAVAGWLLGPELVSLPVHAVIIALAGWSWAYALIGLCVRFLQRDRPAVRYVADSSYWAYLLHLPLLVGFEILIADQPWPIPVKLLLTWAVVGGLLLVSYDLLVRSTWIGKWLNGHRYRSVLGRDQAA